MAEEADHHEGVDEGRVVSNEGLGDVGHDAGVVSWEALGSVHLQEEPGPGPLGGETFRDQKVPEDRGKDGKFEGRQVSGSGNYLHYKLQQQLRTL